MAGLIVLLSGSGSNLQALIDSKFDIKYVISDVPQAYGLRRAEKAKIPTLVQPSIKSLEIATAKICLENDIDLIVLAGFIRLLSPGFVDTWWKKCCSLQE